MPPPRQSGSSSRGRPRQAISYQPADGQVVSPASTPPPFLKPASLKPRLLLHGPLGPQSAFAFLSRFLNGEFRRRFPLLSQSSKGDISDPVLVFLLPNGGEAFGGGFLRNRVSVPPPLLKILQPIGLYLFSATKVWGTLLLFSDATLGQ